MSSQILKNIREAEQKLRMILPEPVVPRIFESTLMVEPGEPVDVPLSWQERWLRPLLHPCTASFEPWVKTRKVTPMVPMKKAIVTRDGIFVHPSMAAELRRQLENHLRKQAVSPYFNYDPMLAQQKNGY